MALSITSYARGVRPQGMAAGLQLPQWWDQVEGPTSNSSSSIQKESYTASKMARFVREALLSMSLTTGLDPLRSLARPGGVIFSCFSSRAMTNCMASMKISCTWFHKATTGRIPRPSLPQMVGRNLNS